MVKPIIQIPTAVALLWVPFPCIMKIISCEVIKMPKTPINDIMVLTV